MLQPEELCGGTLDLDGYGPTPEPRIPAIARRASPPARGRGPRSLRARSAHWSDRREPLTCACITRADRLEISESSSPTSPSPSSPAAAATTSGPLKLGVTIQEATESTSTRARLAMAGSVASTDAPARSEFVIQLMALSRPVVRWRSVASLTEAATKILPWTSTGARFTSIGNCLPSRAVRTIREASPSDVRLELWRSARDARGGWRAAPRGSGSRSARRRAPPGSTGRSSGRRAGQDDHPGVVGHDHCVRTFGDDDSEKVSGLKSAIGSSLCLRLCSSGR